MANLIGLTDAELNETVLVNFDMIVYARRIDIIVDDQELTCTEIVLVGDEQLVVKEALGTIGGGA